ncbi:Rieske (2Fe-2S) protein [Subtercola endophyticus]|uniref:Rieske (2Fe-2S) protein n=1 Tax=Subtercola endophyticus TaxID=2895559 RepID=UPI001E2AB505|nr:Rieske (2Fe-2S) protein [Subtercola endophyticus]UFS58106.1 Rieske (2Fe-2S) protein [Subtercola endophyticus]
MTDERVGSTVATETDGFEYICELDELVPNKIRRSEVGGREIGVVRTVAGVFAIGSSCPHQGGPMCDGAIKGTMEPSDRNEYVFAQEGEVVTCPWHGYEFELKTGASVGGAILGRIGVYQVEVRGTAVFCSSKRIRPQRRRSA